MSITPLPSAPAVTDTTSEFNTKAFNWVAALDPFTTEANALLATCEDAGVTASAAIALVGAVAWVSGTTYAIGDSVYSPIDMQTYRRKTNGGGTTDPSADSTNWTQVVLSETPNVITAVASGSLDNGDTVIVNSDGTVSVVNEVTSFTYGSEATWDSNGSYQRNAAIDPVNGKVVIVNSDSATNAGRAIVGTISGSTITFGTPVNFNGGAAAYYPMVCFSTTDQKFIVAFNYSGYVYCCHGTVSGSTISFSTAAQAASFPIQSGSICYDSANNKAVICCQNYNNGYGYAIVVYVSGAYMGCGTPVAFRSSLTPLVNCAYDSTNGKVVISYQDYNQYYWGTAIVGAVSGTSISFGSQQYFSSVNSDYISMCFDSTNSKIIITYRDSSNSYGKVIVGTVSGTSISFGTAVTFNAGTTYYNSVVHDSSTNKIVIIYRDASDNNYTKAILGALSGTSVSVSSVTVFVNESSQEMVALYNSSNSKTVAIYKSSVTGAKVLTPPYSTLTSENFIGFSLGNYTNGQTATVQISGAVNENQTGLTPGQSYYVQSDGSIGTAVDSPSVFAGTAISTTKLIVKG